MALRVRPAEPSDARFLGWTILAAGRGHLERGWYDIALGLGEDDTIGALERVVTARTYSFWSLANFLVAEVDGEAGAALCAFDTTSGWGDADAAMREAMAPFGWGDGELQAAWDRGRYVFNCTFGGPDASWTIENVATQPQLRGRGLAALLLEAAFAEGKRRGYRQAQLSFLIGNEAAERAYLRAGMQSLEERRHPEFEAACGSPGLKRFGKDLG